MRPVSPRRPVDRATFPVPHGQVFVISERCKGCRFCIEFCPRDVLEEAKEINAKGYHYPVVVSGKENECGHCQFCSLVCPEFAIYTEQRAELAAPAAAPGHDVTPLAPSPGWGTAVHS
jgi:2-oxoglutarate ferredoxin oxidoreductase subunit delta